MLPEIRIDLLVNGLWYPCIIRYPFVVTPKTDDTIVVVKEITTKGGRNRVSVDIKIVVTEVEHTLHLPSINNPAIASNKRDELRKGGYGTWTSIKAVPHPKSTNYWRLIEGVKGRKRI